MSQNEGIRDPRIARIKYSCFSDPLFLHWWLATPAALVFLASLGSYSCRYLTSLGDCRTFRYLANLGGCRYSMSIVDLGLMRLLGRRSNYNSNNKGNK
ncbi:hypothetical protein LIER_29745 [Lithospermum erythrorhizon]|uniref:Uncharacterized protein n=1 Tax=Lithospermum erythrorhizon TaxID=34254 RepID=A0AAV3RR49_LITER